MAKLTTIQAKVERRICGPALSLPARLRQSRNRSQDEQSAKQKRWSEIMADRLNGYRILILVTRQEAQFSRLLTEQGAHLRQCPTFTNHDAPGAAPVDSRTRPQI